MANTLKENVFIEFYGLPGCGKSTVSHAIARQLRESGYEVTEPSFNIDHQRNVLRLLRKSLILLTWYVCHHKHYSAIRKIVYLNGYKGAEALKQITNIIQKVKQYIWTGKNKICVWDQGLIQAAISLSIKGENTAGEIYGELRELLEGNIKILPVYMPVEKEVALKRMSDRQDGNSRVEKLHDDQKKNEMLNLFQQGIDSIRQEYTGKESLIEDTEDLPAKVQAAYLKIKMALEMKGEEKIKVLMVLGNTRMGGTQAFILNLLQYIDRSKYQIDLAINFEGEGGGVTNLFKAYGCNIYFLPYFKVYNYLQFVEAWRKFLSEHHYDIVHGHSTNSASIYLKIAKEKGCATIAHSHSGGYRGNKLQRLLKKHYAEKVGRAADYWFACSDAAASRLFGLDYQSYPRYYAIPNAINSSKYLYNAETAKKLRRDLGVEDDVLLCGHIGTFSAPKNHAFLVEIFSEVCKLQPRAKLLCCGAGGLMDEVKERVSSLGLTDRVIFTGVVTNANEYLMAMDVFIFPSLFEGFPVSVVEAEAAGLPVVMSNVITSEVDLTDLIHRHSLEEPAHLWARTINNIVAKERTQYNSIISKSKYNMEQSIEQISHLYEEMAVKKDSYEYVKETLGGKSLIKIGIAAVTYKENFGSALQTYATQYTLEKMGYDARIFEIKGVHRSIHIKKMLYYAGRVFDPVELKYLMSNLFSRSRKAASVGTDEYAQHMKERKEVYSAFNKKWNKMLPMVHSWKELTRQASEMDTVIVGSDQLWRPSNIVGCYYRDCL